MTTRQANRLAAYSRALGYQAEVVTAGWALPKNAPARNLAVRLRRHAELWAWVFGARGWVATIRHFRDLDRAEGPS